MSCSLPPGKKATAEEGAVAPLWLEDNRIPSARDTLHCPNVVALLVGISQYDPASGWEALQAENDIRLMEATLRQRGVRPANIHRLTDRQATKARMVQALQTVADTLRPGSQFILLYAGHARQIADDNADEKDGYDEAIVPFDAPPAGDLKPDGYLRDDELNHYLTAIRAKLGAAGSVWLLFDSCHSATLNRGSTHQRARGGVLPMGAARRQRRSAKPAYPSASGWYESSSGTVSLASYVLFAATTDGGESYETTDASGRSLGPLTRALCEVWTNRMATETYRQLFERTAVAMARYAPYQQPCLEGDSDRIITGCGSERSTEKYGYHTEGTPIRVTWPRQDVALTQALMALPFVSWSETHPDLRIDRRGRGYRRFAHHKALSKQTETIDECVGQVQDYFARNVLLQLQQTSPDFGVKAVMQRVAVQTNGGHTTVTDTLPDMITTGLPTFTVSSAERVVLNLTNTGPKPFYITVVDLLPDGRLKVLLPEVDRSAGDYRLAPGRTLSRRIRMTEPVGAEVYKLLLTPEPIDLRSILQTRGHSPVYHPYETLFQRTYATRGTITATPVKLSNSAGTTADLVFWVKKTN